MKIQTLGGSHSNTNLPVYVVKQPWSRIINHVIVHVAVSCVSMDLRILICVVLNLSAVGEKGKKKKTLLFVQ